MGGQRSRGSVMQWTNWRGDRAIGKLRVFDYDIITCAGGCGAQTVAGEKKDKAETLSTWRVDHYPDKCYCQKCKEIAK